MPHSAINNDKLLKRRSCSVTNGEQKQKQSNVSTSTKISTLFFSSPRQNEPIRRKMPAARSNTTTPRRSVPEILPSRYIVQYY
jgi:hypothetical protein